MNEGTIRRFCGACGRPVGADAATCAECGASLPAILLGRADETTGAGHDLATVLVRSRLALLALVGAFVAFLYAFYYIGKSHL